LSIEVNIPWCSTLEAGDIQREQHLRAVKSNLIFFYRSIGSLDVRKDLSQITRRVSPTLLTRSMGVKMVALEIMSLALTAFQTFWATSVVFRLS